MLLTTYIQGESTLGWFWHIYRAHLDTSDPICIYIEHTWMLLTTYIQGESTLGWFWHIYRAHLDTSDPICIYIEHTWMLLTLCIYKSSTLGCFWPYIYISSALLACIWLNTCAVCRASPDVTDIWASTWSREGNHSEFSIIFQSKWTLCNCC